MSNESLDDIHCVLPRDHAGDCETQRSRSTCAWCTTAATGLARHNDGLSYPSCGQPDHGRCFAPDLMAALRVSVVAAREARGAVVESETTK